MCFYLMIKHVNTYDFEYVRIDFEMGLIQYAITLRNIKKSGVIYFQLYIMFQSNKGPCGRDSMVVGYTTTCAISAYHH
jgi:hypothetical protein